MKLISYLVLLVSTILVTATENLEESKITVKNITPWKGNLVMTIFNSKGSYLKTPFKEIIVPVVKVDKPDELDIKFSLPPGNYAVVIYHDINTDGEHIQDINYKKELEIQRLKRSL